MITEATALKEFLPVSQSRSAWEALGLVDLWPPGSDNNDNDGVSVSILMSGCWGHP